MEKLFLPYELADLAKDKGFNEPCIATISKHEGLYLNEQDATKNINTITNSELNKKYVSAAPLYQQIVDWFRTEHKICISIQFVGTVRKTDYYVGYVNKGFATNEYKNYYEALNAAITEAFKLI